VYCRSEAVPRLREHRHFQTPFSSEFEQVEPHVVGWFLGIEAFDVPRVDMYRVHRWFTVIKPECSVITCWRLVRRSLWILFSLERTVGAFLRTCNETANTGCVSWLTEIESFDERVALVFTQDCAECSPDIVPGWILGFVIEVFVEGLFELLVLRPARNGTVRSGSIRLQFRPPRLAA
jgi:hypothetical protein